MRVSKQALREAKALYRGCLPEGVLDENRVRQALRELVTRRPRGYVAILTQFHRLVKLYLERRTARIESPVAIPAELSARLQENLTRRYGAGLRCEFSTNPALIGGVRIKVGSDVYDGSIQGRLRALLEGF